MTPSPAYLMQVEQAFGASFPDAFHRFCRVPAAQNVADGYPGLRRGQFITDTATLEAINTQIGEEEWGDYERIIAHEQHPKSGGRLWGGLLPFYFEPPKRRKRKHKLADLVYGFPADAPGSERVLVWSVHCVVHDYATLQAWLDELGT